MSATLSTNIEDSPAVLRRRRARWAAVRSTLTSVAVIVSLIAIWEAGTRAFGIPAFILPPPSAIFHDTAALGWSLVGHVAATLETILAGYFLAILISFPLAIAISSSSVLANALYPLLIIKQSIPIVALAPILIVILGAGEAPRITVTVLIALFPMVVANATGLSQTPSELIELSNSMGASWFKQLIDIRLPSAIPYIFSGLKVSMPLSIVGAVVAEFVASERGLGFLIFTSTAFFHVSISFGAMFLLSIMGLLLFQSVNLIERKFFPWSIGGNPAGME